MGIKIKVIFIGLWLCSIMVAESHSGITIGLTNNGTGVKYFFAGSWSSHTQTSLNAGVHLEKKSTNYDPYYSYYQSTESLITFLPVSLTLTRSFFNDVLAGTFRPLVECEAGFITKLGKYDQLLSQRYDWESFWAVGPGVQFGLGKSITRISLNYMSNDLLDGSMLIRLSMFWN